EALAVRRRLPILRQRAFLHGGERGTFGRDVAWLRADGNLVEEEDWQDPDFRTVVAVLRGAAGDPYGEAINGAVAIIVNLGEDTTVDLPAGNWR
ncbi:glycogen debranching enzyme GlgX, partial [Leifsonia sp. SIMBA_070]